MTSGIAAGIVSDELLGLDGAPFALKLAVAVPVALATSASLEWLRRALGWGDDGRRRP